MVLFKVSLFMVIFFLKKKCISPHGMEKLHVDNFDQSLLASGRSEMRKKIMHFAIVNGEMMLPEGEKKIYLFYHWYWRNAYTENQNYCHKLTRQDKVK